MLLNQLSNFVSALGNRQGIVELWVRDHGVALPARLIALARLRQRGGQLLVELIVRFLLTNEVVALFGECDQAATIGSQNIVELNAGLGHRARILRARCSWIRLIHNKPGAGCEAVD